MFRLRDRRIERLQRKHLAEADQPVILHWLGEMFDPALHDVVITDLGMPHVDGRKVAASIHVLSPHTPIIMLTGHDTDSDTILGLDLAHGGHLTHGSPFNFSGILFQSHFYGVRKSDQRIDYDQVRDQSHETPARLLARQAG